MPYTFIVVETLLCRMSFLLDSNRCNGRAHKRTKRVPEYVFRKACHPVTPRGNMLTVAPTPTITSVFKAGLCIYMYAR